MLYDLLARLRALYVPLSPASVETLANGATVVRIQVGKELIRYEFRNASLADIAACLTIVIYGRTGVRYTARRVLRALNEP